MNWRERRKLDKLIKAFTTVENYYLSMATAYRNEEDKSMWKHYLKLTNDIVDTKRELLSAAMRNIEGRS